MQWQPISSFNPNDYKQGDTFNIFTEDGHYDLVTVEIIKNSYSGLHELLSAGEELEFCCQPFLKGDVTLYYRFNNMESVPIKFETITHFMKLEQPKCNYKSLGATTLTINGKTFDGELFICHKESNHE